MSPLAIWVVNLSLPHLTRIVPKGNITCGGLVDEMSLCQLKTGQMLVDKMKGNFMKKVKLRYLFLAMIFIIHAPNQEVKRKVLFCRDYGKLSSHHENITC